MYNLQKTLDNIDKLETAEQLEELRFTMKDSSITKLFWEQRLLALNGETEIVRKKALLKCRAIAKHYCACIPVKKSVNRFTTPHGFAGIHISMNAKVGKGCTIFQHVGIGSNTLPDSKNQGFPTIGDNVYIGAGAMIIGNVHVGNNVRIGANAIVTKDVPDNSVVILSGAKTIVSEQPLNNKFVAAEHYTKPVSKAQVTSTAADLKKIDVQEEPTEIRTQKSPYTIQYTIQEICDVIGAELPEQYGYLAELKPERISYSTNYLSANNAYFLDGTLEQRKDRLAKAVEEKVAVVFTSSTEKTLPELNTIPHVYVESVTDAIICLAKAMRKTHGNKVVCVTGSVGKTTTKELIYTVLGKNYVTGKTPGNLNGIRPMIELLQRIPKGTEFFVQELGVGFVPKMMIPAARACMSDAAVFTTITDMHLDVLGSRENILKEKLYLATEMEVGNPVFLNYDDELLREVQLADHPIISYAVNNKQANYYADNLEVFEDYMTFDIVHGEQRTPVVLHSRGIHNVGNALAAAAVGEWFGMSAEQVAEGIESFRNTGIRQNLVDIGGYKLYVDCFNIAPVSLLGAVEVIERMQVQEDGKRVAVVGDIARLGSQEKQIHIELGEKIGQSNLDIVLCFGNENAKLMADAIRQYGKEVYYTSYREELNAWMHNMISKKDVVLLKGAHRCLLTKSVDQVYGSALQLSQAHYEWKNQGDWRFKICLDESGTEDAKNLAALGKYQGVDIDLEIPAHCGDIDVFCIGPKCFFRDVKLRKVTIPDPIFHICAGAFRGCLKLSEVELPETLMGIGNKAFRYCSALSELVIPEGVLDIGEEAFACCKSLHKLVLPKSVGHIGENAFVDCPKLTIFCAEGSYAHEYAKKNNLKFELAE